MQRLIGLWKEKNSWHFLIFSPSSNFSWKQYYLSYSYRPRMVYEIAKATFGHLLDTHISCLVGFGICFSKHAPLLPIQESGSSTRIKAEMIMHPWPQKNVVTLISKKYLPGGSPGLDMAPLGGQGSPRSRKDKISRAQQASRETDWQGRLGHLVSRKGREPIRMKIIPIYLFIHHISSLSFSPKWPFWEAKGFFLLVKRELTAGPNRMEFI